MEITNQCKTTLEHLHSYDEFSSYIEQSHPILEEEIQYLEKNLREIIRNNERLVSDESIIRFFLNIQKIFPYSPRLISLLFQLNDEEIARKFMKEHKDEIIPILKEVWICQITEEEYEMNWDEDVVLSTQFPSPHFESIIEKLVLYTRFNKSSTILAFIEEFLPYLWKPDFDLELNLACLLEDKKSINQYAEKHFYQGKVSINFLFQVKDNQHSFLLSNLLKHIENIEFYMIGKERLIAIENILNHQNLIEVKETLKEKVLDAIIPSREFTIPKDIHDISTVSFMQNILYLQEEFIKGNPYFESELYNQCLNAILNRYKTSEPERLKKEIDKYLKKVIIEENTQEIDPLLRKEKLLNNISELLKNDSDKELLTFFRTGRIIHSSYKYTIEQLFSYDSKDFFNLLEIIESRYDIVKFRYHYPEEQALRCLIILEKELSFLSTIKLNTKTQSQLLKIAEKNSKEENSLFFELLKKLLQLMEKYQNVEPYKETDLQKETFKLYETWIKKELKEEEIDSKKLSFIFHKIIQTENLKTYLFDINSKKKITLIYKTPYANINEDDFTIEQIEEFNPKQYKDIRNQVLLLFEKENQAKIKLENETKIIRKSPEEIKINTISLKLITYLDYELSKLILKDPNVTFSKLKSFLSEIPNSMSHIEEFQKCLKKHPHIFNLDKQLLKNYFSWYMDLSNNLNKNVTYEDIVKYESGAKANLFENPIYFPIIKNVFLIQANDFEKNAYKTSILWEKQLKRIETTIPELKGNIGEYSYQMVDLHDPDLIFLPNMIKCCMEVGGKAEADLAHAVTNKNGRMFAIYQEKDVKAISWVWRNGQVLCFDNIEVKRGEETEQFGTIIKEILTKASHDLIEISKQNEPSEESIKTVTLGRNPKDIPIKLEKNSLLSNYQSRMYFPEEKESLYLVDSSEVQYIIGGTYTPMTEKKVSTIYLYPRKAASKFENLDVQYLDNMIKSIRRQKGMLGEGPIYLVGYLGEDFYVGITEFGSIDTVYLETDSRVEEDVISSLEKVKEEHKQKKEFEDQQQEMIKQIMDTSYEIDSEQVSWLLEKIKKAPPYNIEEGAYYHGSTLEYILDMIRRGSINCKYRLRQRGSGSNGDYYICVAKNLRVKSNSFEGYIKNKLSIILKKELPVLDKSSQECNFLDPFFKEGKRRQYNYDDEFQVRDRIEFPYFEGIYVPTQTENDLINIRKIIDLQETFERDLPIISNTSNTLIDKELIKTYLKPQTKGD